jgi:coproporphyrinogen III oxidase
LCRVQAPTAHFNYRVFVFSARVDGVMKYVVEYGGGADLTPSYLFPEDAKAFHAALKVVTSLHPTMLLAVCLARRRRLWLLWQHERLRD